MTDNPILVIGARGKTGRHVVSRLQERGVPVRAASRSTGTRFDFADRSTWGPALDGTGAVYLVPMTEYADVGAVLAFIREIGDRRVVLLSSRGLTEGAAHPIQEPYETAVRESAAEWTILRPGWFSQNFSEDFFHPLVLAGEMALSTGEGREAFVDTRDIADVAVEALTGAGHSGKIYELTGPEALDFGDVAARISAETGRPLRYTPISGDAFRQALTAEGTPADLAEVLAGLLEAIRDGVGEKVTDDVRRVLGREPRTFAEYAKETAATGVWTPRG
ncbi:NAD(P)H-binding protein [Spirillospora sp. CA-294931]|uniref:NAD(P)H-binding protein n=1 Tax=Spirillospora sp. CA-294931 TaxID=3240042 RepID=UPI003D94F4C8